MILLPRLWIAIFAAGLGWIECACAQESPATGSSSGSGNTSGSSSANPALGSGSGSSSSFNVFSSEPATTPTESGPTQTGATPKEETGTGFSTPSFGAAAAKTPPPSFTVPGFYGQGSTTFFGGTGRLARPRFRTSFTFGLGYDDNLYSAPSEDTPSIIPGPAQVVDTGGQPIVVQQRQLVAGFKDYTTAVTVGTTQQQVENTETVVPAQERKGSMFTRAGLSIEMQTYTPRSLFTLNAAGSHTYYWDRDKDPVDYSGSFAMTYLYRVTPRLQMTAQVNAAYISQPDLSRPNTPQQQIQGSLLNALGRLDVAYRITPRLSLTSSSNYNGNRYTEEAEQTGDFDEYTFGIEAKYLWNPRLTLLAEYRHGITLYLNRDDLDSNTDYLLVGGEFIISQRLSGSVRIGEAIKAFDQSGNSQSAPYVESSIVYRSTARSSVTWNNRFGFEEPASPDEERLVYRGTVSYNYMFTPHLQAQAGANLIHEITRNKTADTEVAQDTFELTLGLEYDMTRNFSLNGNYTFTISNSNTGTNDYYRNRVFVGGQYSF